MKNKTKKLSYSITLRSPEEALPDYSVERLKARIKFYELEIRYLRRMLADNAKVVQAQTKNVQSVYKWVSK